MEDGRRGFRTAHLEEDEKFVIKNFETQRKIKNEKLKMKNYNEAHSIYCFYFSTVSF